VTPAMDRIGSVIGTPFCEGKMGVGRDESKGCRLVLLRTQEPRVPGVALCNPGLLRAQENG